MSKVDIKLLKKLRELTNAPLKDCKKALIESWDDLEKAQEVLRRQWAIKAAKKANRETNEWIVRVKKEDNIVIGVKLACETDFVAKNEKFIESANKILDIILSFEEESINSMDDLSSNEKEKINNIISDTVAVVWENVQVAGILKIKADQSFVYEHPGNKVAGVVVYNSTNKKANEIAKELALQSVAMDPEYIRIEDIPQDIKDDLYYKFKEEIITSWKPENIVENIVQGKLNKYFSSIVLIEQQRIRDDSKKVKSIIPWDFELVDVIRYSI